jgi:hypothetical protein
MEFRTKKYHIVMKQEFWPLWRTERRTDREGANSSLENKHPAVAVIGTTPQLAQKLVFSNLDLDKSTTVWAREPPKQWWVGESEPRAQKKKQEENLTRVLSGRLS